MTYNDQVDIDVASDDDVSIRKRGSAGREAGDPTTEKGAGTSPDLNAIWNELMNLKDIVEDQHDRKLRRIESDLRWTMTLVGAQFITIIGSAIAMLAGG